VSGVLTASGVAWFPFGSLSPSNMGLWRRPFLHLFGPSSFAAFLGDCWYTARLTERKERRSFSLPSGKRRWSGITCCAAGRTRIFIFDMEMVLVHIGNLREPISFTLTPRMSDSTLLFIYDDGTGPSLLYTSPRVTNNAAEARTQIDGGIRMIYRGS